MIHEHPELDHVMSPTVNSWSHNAWFRQVTSSPEDLLQPSTARRNWDCYWRKTHKFCQNYPWKNEPYKSHSPNLRLPVVKQGDWTSPWSFRSLDVPAVNEKNMHQIPWNMPYSHDITMYRGENPDFSQHSIEIFPVSIELFHTSWRRIKTSICARGTPALPRRSPRHRTRCRCRRLSLLWPRCWHIIVIIIQQDIGFKPWISPVELNAETHHVLWLRIKNEQTNMIYVKLPRDLLESTFRSKKWNLIWKEHLKVLCS